MTNDKKRHVIPGEVIVSGNYRSEQNTFTVGDKIVSSIIGLSDIRDDGVRVIQLTGGYIPKDDDLVIAPNLSITFGLAAAGISSIAFSEPFGCQSSFFRVPVDFKTVYDCATN